jgi:hypothetical protein
MKHLKTFENFKAPIDFKAGETYMCTMNVDNIFKKGAIVKVEKIEDGVLYLDNDQKIGMEEAQQVFIKHKVTYSKYDRTENHEKEEYLVVGAEEKNINNI